MGGRPASLFDVAAPTAATMGRLPRDGGGLSSAPVNGGPPSPSGGTGTARILLIHEGPLASCGPTQGAVGGRAAKRPPQFHARFARLSPVGPGWPAGCGLSRCRYDPAVRILVTAGPTREWIDDVRYLSNESSGVMGYAVARAARDRGHETLLVSGPTALPDPEGVSVVRVETAAEMHRACREAFPGCDAAFMVAAVADYRPETRAPGKLKKAADRLTLTLVKNPDILADLGMMRGRRTLVGFALESAPAEEALALARGKLRSKGADLVVLNTPASFGGPAAHDVVLVTEREAVPLGRIEKSRLAEHLVRFVEDARGTALGSVDGSSTNPRVRDDPRRGPS
jgi:hypothetical protein